jgi:ABC-type uncharacterized transport system ATPase subunit
MGYTKPTAQSQVPNKPVFFLLAGPNGAGKSTLYKVLVLAGTIVAKTQTEHQSHYFYLRKDPLEPFTTVSLQAAQCVSGAVAGVPWLLMAAPVR